MRYGFTTGSCAAAASKAAIYMLLSGKIKQDITIETPKGISWHTPVEEIERGEGYVSCAVQKDGGDDPDITNGAYIFSKVEILNWNSIHKNISGREHEKAFIRIDGGFGVGRVTKPGLDQPVGNAAINHVPREMIAKEVTEVCELFDFHGELLVTISVPQGEALAQRTLNPKLGIVGGISILGTTGIVEPMSTQALLDTIRVELRQKYAQGHRLAAISPGNYGLAFMQRTYGYHLDRSVKCSNFVGDTIDMAVELGYSRLLLTGHIGKLIKLSGGIMNTHSREGDCRMELFAAAALRCGIAPEIVRRILDCVTTEDAIAQIMQQPEGEKQLKVVMGYLMEQILFYLNRRAEGKLEIACILYSNDYGELAKSENAEEFLKICME